MHRIFSYFKRLLRQNYGRGLLYGLAFFLLFLVLWAGREFGSITMDQVVFHFQHGAEGLEGFDRKILSSFFRYVVLGSTLASLVALILDRGLCACLSQCNPRSRMAVLGGIVASLVPLYLFCAAGAMAYQRLNMAAYFSDAPVDDYFARHYTPPREVEVTPAPTGTKNLVLIYVESLEAAYSDPNLFGQDLLAPLNAIEGVRFSKYRQVPGTGWTMAGITASQCGLPLKPVALADGNATGKIFKKFLPGALCLGDTLQAFGYRNVFMGGADLGFSGKGKFFRDHGYGEIYGKDEWLASGRYHEADLGGWGLPDDALFAEARQKLDALEASGQRFNLTLLTVSTHFPHGFMSKNCVERGGKTFTDTITCTAQDLADFIHYMEGKGYLKNTSLVIMGDHLTMPNDVSDVLNKVEDRRIYNLWIGQGAPHPHRQELVHFDVVPSLLAFIGFDVQGGRYGLGYTAFHHTGAQPPADRVAQMRAFLWNPSNAYSKLWVTSAGERGE